MTFVRKFNGKWYVCKSRKSTKQAMDILKDWWREIGKETFEKWCRIRTKNNHFRYKRFKKTN